MNDSNDDAEYALYCDGLERQYKNAKEGGLFEVLKIIDLDKANSSLGLVEAVDYFKNKDGDIEKDAPTGFLKEREKAIVNKNGKFRPDLYVMFLSQCFAESLKDKTAFLMHSLQYAFDK